MMAESRDGAGRMKESHYNIWLTNTNYLIGEFSPDLPRLVTRFRSKDLITEEDKILLQRQARKEGNTKAASCFVDMLLDRGESFLPDIIATLREEKYIAAADKLDTDMKAQPVDSSESRGAMNPGHLGVWRDLTPKLVEHFKKHLHDLIDAFREAVILGDDGKTKILNIDEEEKCDNASAGATALVDALAKSGPNVLPNIIKVLHDNRFTALALELQSRIDKLNEIIDDVVDGLPEVP